MSNIKKQILDFTLSEFDQELKIIEKSNQFLGYGTDQDTLENVLLWRKFFQPSSYFGHTIAKNVSIVSDFRGLKDIWVTDSMGVCKNKINAIDTEKRIAIANEQNLPIISFFGGSTIQGVGSYMPDFTIPSLVEKILFLEHNINSVCINHGVAGWSSTEELSYLLHRLDYKPTHTIFYDGWNCVWNFYNGVLINHYSKDDSNIKWGKGTSLRHVEYDHNNYLQFSVKWHLTKALNLMINNFFNYLNKKIKNKKAIKISSIISSKLFPIRRANIFEKIKQNDLPENIRNQYLNEICNEYIRIDQIAKTVCANWGIEFVHFMQPTLLTTSRPYTNKELKLLELGESMPNSEVFSLFPKSIMERYHPKHLIDITDTFDNINEDVFQDDGHLNPLGNYFVAKKIVMNLLTQDLIKFKK